MKIKAVILILCMTILIGCNEDNPVTPSPPPNPIEKKYWQGIPHAKAFDNLQLIQSLERHWRRDTVLFYIHGGIELNGTISNGSAWYYIFGKIKDNIETNYDWYAWDNGKIELGDIGPPIKSNPVAELGPFLKINSDQAIQLARQNGAKSYVQHHPHAQVRIDYIFKWSIPAIFMKFSDPDQIGECEPEWWIRSDTGEFLYTDYQYCHE